MRTYRGHRFWVDIPAAWEDRSRPMLLGPFLGHDRAGLSLQLEPHCKAAHAQDYARQRIDGLVATLPGWDLLRHVGFPAEENPETVLLELVGPGEGAHRQYRRFYFRVLRGTGVIAIVQLGRPSRKRMSQALDEMVRSIALRKPGDPEDATEEPGDGGEGPPRASAYEMGGLRMRLYPRWEDATQYELGLPRAAGGIRNLIIRRERWGERHAGMPDLQKQAEIELDLMRRSVPGFELLEQDEVALATGASVPRLRFLRTAGHGPGDGAGLPLEQRITLVADADELFFLCLTSEPEPDEELCADYDRVQASFAIDPL